MNRLLGSPGQSFRIECSDVKRRIPEPFFDNVVVILLEKKLAFLLIKYIFLLVYYCDLFS